MPSVTITGERAWAVTDRRRMLVAAVAFLVVAGGWLGYRQVAERAPFSAADVPASAVVRFTEWPRFAEDAASIGAGDLGVRPGGAAEDRIFVARVEHRTPAVDRTFSYRVAVVDEYHNRAAGVGNVGGGRPQWLDSVASSFPALARNDDATCCWVKEAPAGGPGVITFAGTVRDGEAMTEADLTVVLMLVGEDGTVLWSTRVPH
jgi:hypothetical protein